MVRSTVIFLALGAIGCGDESLLASDFSMADTASAYAPEAGGEADGDADADADEEPEDETDELALAPAATDAYVFVANPQRDTVTRISVSSLAALTAPVGDYPSMVVTSADYTRAVTFNERSEDVSIIDAETMAVTSVRIRDDLNTMALSDDGEWIMAWYDPDKQTDNGTSGGVQSFNEVSFVRLDDAAHFPMAVGFSPSGVRWTDDGTRAVVVSDGSLAVIDLAAATPSPRLIAIAEDELDAPVAEEVELSPGGAWAFVRQRGTDSILVVDLAEGVVEAVPVGENPTDMDRTPDGTHLAIVARGARKVLTLDALDPFAAPESIDFPSDAAYGSVVFARDGTRGILYTNASLVPSYVSWDTATGAMVERSLMKPVQSVGIAPNGASLFVFHTLADAPDADPGDPFYGEWAMTPVSLDDFRSNPQILSSEPSGYTVGEDGAFGYFMLERQPYLEVLDFNTLLPEEVKLGSLPVFVGTLPGSSTAWASQEHELGRISFYDPIAGTLDTITGFELNSEIDHE